MNRNLKKAISVLLSLLLVFGLFALPVSAAEAEEETALNGYLAIADSIGRGCGSEGFYLDRNGNPLPEGDEGGQYDEFDMRNVQGSYTTVIAESLGYEMPYYMTDQTGTFWPLCYPGMTTSVMMDLMGIEDDFDDVKLDYANYDWMLAYFGSEDYSVDGLKEGDDTKEAVISRFGGLGQVGAIDELAKKANLITVELGMCDIFYRAYRVASDGSMFADGLNIDISDIDGLKELISIAIEEMYFGYNYWKTWYPALIEQLISWNPDATIVLVGAFNLVNQLRITNDDAIPLGSIISALTNAMNRNYEKWADEFGDNVIYVDVSNTEPLVAEKEWALLGDFLDNSFAAVHPSQNGHDYMARQVLSALENTSNGKNIVVDLGRFDRVDYVLVNGIRTNNYSMDGFVLTIPCNTILARNLTIGIVDENGAVAVQTYKLSYSSSSGYTAHRLYGTNDIADTVDKNNFFLKFLKMIYEKIVEFFKGLFNK